VPSPMADDEEEGPNIDAIKAQLSFLKREVQERVFTELELQERLASANQTQHQLGDELLDANDRHARTKHEYDQCRTETDVVESRYQELMRPEVPDDDGPMFVETEPEAQIELIPHYSAMEQIHMHVEATKKERREEEWMAAQQLNPGGGGEVIVEAQDFGIIEENRMKIFHVSEDTTFADLRKDVEAFWNLPKDSVYVTTRKGVIWTGGATVLDHIQRLEEELVLYDNFDDEDLYVQAFPKPGQEEEEEARKKKRKQTRTKKSPEDEEAERWRLREERLASSMRWQICPYLVYTVGVILIATYRIPLKPAFEMMNSIQAVVEDDFPPELGHNQKNMLDVANTEEFYSFLKFPWLGGISEDPWLIGNNNQVVGGFRIRNQRVKPNSTCTIFPQFNKFEAYDQCYSTYTSEARDEEPYGEDVLYNGLLTKKFHFWASEYSMTTTMGKLGSYDGDGYIFDCNRVWDEDLSWCLKGVQGLEDQSFIDDATRAVFITATVYNRNFQMWAWVKLGFEFSAGGLTYAWGQYTPLKLDLYFTEEDTLRLVFEIICVVLTLFYTAMFIREIILAKKEVNSLGAFFGEFWNWYELMMLILAYATIGLTLWYYFTVQAMAVSVEEMYYVDMEAPSQAYSLVGQIMSVFSFLAILKLFKYMAISQKLGLIGRAIGKGGADLGTFMFVFVILYFAFVFMGYQIFGPDTFGYCTIFKSVTSLFLSSAGVVDYHDLEQSHPIFAPLFWILYVIVVILILLNMFIGIICGAFSEESAALEVTLMDEINEAKKFFVDRWEALTKNDEEARLLAELAEGA